MKLSKKQRIRWPRHGSSSCNPTGRLFREAIKDRHLFERSGPSCLTVSTVKQHDDHYDNDEANKQKIANIYGSDAGTNNSWKTWATSFTNCTNMSFAHLHCLSDDPTAVEKETIIHLAGITRMIDEDGGNGNNTEHFCKTLIFLNKLLTEDGRVGCNSVRLIPSTFNEGCVSSVEEKATAIARILHCVVKRIDSCGLITYFSLVNKILILSLTRFADSQHAALLSNLVQVFAVVLAVQPVGVWKQPTTQHGFNSILHFTTHTKPKVRKGAQQAVRLVLMGSDLMSLSGCPSWHPAAPLTAEFCWQVLSRGLNSGRQSDVVHVLQLLSGVLATFPQQALEKTCRSILGLLRVSNMVVLRVGMDTFHRLFAQRPSRAVVSTDFNGKMINALRDYQPEMNDTVATPTWLIMMEQIHLNLARNDLILCMEHLPFFVSVCMKFLMSHHKEIRNTAFNVVKVLLTKLLGADYEILRLECNKNSSMTRIKERLSSIVALLDQGLGLQCNKSWDIVLCLLSILVQVVGKICPDLLFKCLQSVAELRDMTNFVLKSEADLVIGNAVKVLGVRAVLQAIPFNITGHEENPDLCRSWLLPVIRDSVSHSELSIFEDVFLPLAAAFRKRAQAEKERGLLALEITYNRLEIQVWSTLRGFCTDPTDISHSFPKLAKRLADTFINRAELQMDILASLRLLVKFSLQNEIHKRTMARFANNFISMLLKEFMVEVDCDNKTLMKSDGRRLAVFETLKSYLVVAPLQLCSVYLGECITRLNAEDKTVFSTVALFDVASALVKHVDSVGLLKLYSDVVLCNYMSPDRTVQKKVFRILEEICSSQCLPCREFLSSHLHELQQLLTQTGSLMTCSMNTLHPRLRCLTCICENLTDSSVDFVKLILPQVIQCTTGVSQRAVSSAYKLVVVMANALLRWNTDMAESDVLHQYCILLMPGLVSSPESTLLAFTRILFHFKMRLSAETLSDLVSLVCRLLRHDRRSTVKAAVGFVGTFLAAGAPNILCAYLCDLVEGLAAVHSTDNSIGGLESSGNKVRLFCYKEIKQICKKMVRKFGYEDVLKVAPDSMHRLFHRVHMELRQERRKRDRKMVVNRHRDADDNCVPLHHTKPETIDEFLQDSNSDRETEETKISFNSKKDAKCQQSFIKEENEEDVIDLMDSRAARCIVAGKKMNDMKQSKAAGELASGFVLAPDGRMIITDHDNDRAEKETKVLEAVDEKGSDMMSDLDDCYRTNRVKRSHSASDGVNDSVMTYRAGGSGIHRGVRNVDFGSEFRAKKAMGDVRRKGKLEPYAYIPLHLSTLNKRRQCKLKGQFNRLVSGVPKASRKARGFKS